jgi:hypothetical protein
MRDQSCGSRSTWSLITSRLARANRTKLAARIIGRFSYTAQSDDYLFAESDNKSSAESLPLPERKRTLSRFIRQYNLARNNKVGSSSTPQTIFKHLLQGASVTNWRTAIPRIHDRSRSFAKSWLRPQPRSERSALLNTFPQYMRRPDRAIDRRATLSPSTVPPLSSTQEGRKLVHSDRACGHYARAFASVTLRLQSALNFLKKLCRYP